MSLVCGATCFVFIIRMGILWVSGLVPEKSWGICKKWKFLVRNLVFLKRNMYSSLFSAEQGYMYVVPDFALYGMIISIGIILMILLRYDVFSCGENHGNEKKKILMAYLIRFFRKI